MTKLVVSVQHLKLNLKFLVLCNHFMHLGITTVWICLTYLNSFADAATMLAEESAKPICKRFFSSGEDKH